MGVKDLWTVLTPYCDRRPIYELRGKTVAIDLAGWVCESLNVVDYFIHPRHHLKNLFFRTCYLLWEEVTPIFVLEGEAPKLKSQVIAKRNEIQFRGVRPKKKPSPPEKSTKPRSQKEARSRFNQVLRQCQLLLNIMGVHCVQAPGEAEAFCAFLNKKGHVQGVISQDSDCFAYGAVKVYRNFSISTQGSTSAQGGSVDIYDMEKICKLMDFGQNKIIAMALFCGCDYCPDGIGGIGRDGVLKLFTMCNNEEILERIRSWRRSEAKYTQLDMQVNDKTTCTDCGHLGRIQKHKKSGCGICRTTIGCDEALWREKRLAIKSELSLRTKALCDPFFPCEEIIKEFLTEPSFLPALESSWNQPNIVEFVQKVSNLLEWPEIYCFQKFFPILTRWQVRHPQRVQMRSGLAYVVPSAIKKNRTLKGIPSLEVLWIDKLGFFDGLLPDEQLNEFKGQNPNGLDDLWTTVEPFNLMEQAYPDTVMVYLRAKEEEKKAKKLGKRKAKVATARNTKDAEANGSLDSMKALIDVTNDIAKTLKPKRKRKDTRAKAAAGLQKIDKFLAQPVEREADREAAPRNEPLVCSTPNAKWTSFTSDNDENMDLSEVIDGIINKSAKDSALRSHEGRRLLYESFKNPLRPLAKKGSTDDLDLFTSIQEIEKAQGQKAKQDAEVSLDDSFDVLVAKGNRRMENAAPNLYSHIERFKERHGLSTAHNINVDKKTVNDNDSSFFNVTKEDVKDDFEIFMESSFGGKEVVCNDNKDNDDDDDDDGDDDDDVIVISEEEN